MPDTSIVEGVANITESQKHGQMPYPYLFNLVYSLNGFPLISSFPNFAHSNPKVLSQNQNSPRTLSADGGINIYRGMSDYSKNAAVLALPEPVTEGTWSQYKDVYSGVLNIEPAIGVSLTGLV